MKTTLFSLILCLLPAMVVAQQCDENIVNEQSFTRMTNGAIKDNATGIVWHQCHVGEVWNGSECEGNAAKVTFMHAAIEARRFSEQLNEKWRLPTTEELISLVSPNCNTPAIDLEYFPNTKNDQYWSDERFSFFAHVVSFDFGYTFTTQMKNPKYIRLVKIE